MNAQALLVVRHLTMAYPAVVALDDVSLAVDGATVHAVVGMDGAGKTTLMKILGGYIKDGAYSGEILMHGEPLHLRSLSEGLHHGIAIVPRKISVFDTMSVAENVMMAGWQMEKRFVSSRSKTEDRAQEILDRWGINVELGAKVPELSPIQRRELMLARALAVDPALVVLDEPMAGITGAHAASRLIRLVRRLPENGVTCLYLSRRPVEAVQVADAVTVLRDGAVAGEWQRAEFDETAMTTAMQSDRLDDDRDTRVEDDFGERSGAMSQLRGIFDRWWKPGA